MNALLIGAYVAGTTALLLGLAVLTAVRAARRFAPDETGADR